ncbi:MAG: hypothetical protein ACI837_003235 [Crocinitomicaceae bacterium]|jgi:hypothetical protein
MLINQFSDLQFCLQLITVIVSIGSVISSLEDLSILRNFKNDGILSWEVSSLNYPWMSRGRIAPILDYLLDYKRFKYLIVLKLLSSASLIGLVFFIDGWIISVLLSFATITTLSFNVRNPFGIDGSHQMTLIIYTMLFLSSISADGSIAQIACIWFIAIQSCLSYFVAGVYKLISPVWRNGIALVGILSTEMYGNKMVYNLMAKNLRLSKFFCWVVIIFECAYPLALINIDFAFVFVLIGILFHLNTSIVMTLNIFFWAFLASYPAIIYCANSW